MAKAMAAQPPQDTEPPDFKGKAKDEGYGSHEDGIVSGKAHYEYGLGQGAGKG